jgi:hypothetical protein
MGSYLCVWHWAQAIGDAHPDLHGGVDAIDDGGGAELLVVGAALVVVHRVAVERGGDEVVVGGVVDRRSPASWAMVNWSKGSVAVERADDPVAVGPDDAAVVLRSPWCRRSARGRATRGPSARRRRAREKSIDDALVGTVGFLAAVGEEGVDLLGRRGRQAGEIEGHAAEQGLKVGLGRGREPFLFKACENERINEVPAPRRVLHYGRVGLHGRHERPVRLVLRALLDPLRQRRDFRGRECLVHLGRGHAFVVVARRDALDEFALAGLGGDDGASALLGRRRCVLKRVEARRPPSVLPSSGPWHLKQLLERIGRMSALKSTRSAAVGAGESALAEDSLARGRPTPSISAAPRTSEKAGIARVAMVVLACARLSDPGLRRATGPASEDGETGAGASSCVMVVALVCLRSITAHPRRLRLRAGRP